MTNRLIAATFSLIALTSVAHAKDIRIATEGAYPPFNYLDPAGELHGFDVDIAHALCERMKANCTITAQDWDGIIPGLLANKYDAIVASMTVTEARKKQVAFTNRYYVSSLAVAVTNDSDIKDASPESMKGKIVGSQSSSNQGYYAQDVYGPAGADIKLYPTQDAAASDLINGRVDAVVDNIYPLLEWLKADGKDCCKTFGPIPNSGGDTGIAVRQEDTALREEFNAALASIMADGTYQKINAKYFPFDINK